MCENPIVVGVVEFSNSCFNCNKKVTWDDGVFDVGSRILLCKTCAYGDKKEMPVATFSNKKVYKCVFVTNIRNATLPDCFDHCDDPAIFEFKREGNSIGIYCGKHADILLKTGEAKNGELKRMVYEEEK